MRALGTPPALLAGMMTSPIQAPAPGLRATATTPTPTLTEQLRAMTPEAIEGARDVGIQQISADCRGKTLPGFRCVPGTNHLNQVGHFWTAI